MAEPTMKDMHQAATWLNAAFGDHVKGSHVESLSWLVAKIRADERADCARRLNKIAGLHEGHDGMKSVLIAAEMLVKVPADTSCKEQSDG